MQNRHQVTIRDKLIEGVHISHVLHVQIFNAEPEAALAIRKYVKERVWNEVHTSSLTTNGITYPIEIRWEMPGADDTCDYFYAVDLPYTDVVVDTHTRDMLRNIHASLRASRPDLGTGWTMAYLITHPAQRNVPIAPELIVVEEEQ